MDMSSLLSSIYSTANGLSIHRRVFSLISKAKAKEILQVNYNTLVEASVKLEDDYLLAAFSSAAFPISYKAVLYLKRLGYDTTALPNECVSCGIKYFYTPMCTPTHCRYCANKHLYKSRMIVEPATLSELIHNLTVLSEMFDHEQSDTNFKSEIEALQL